MIGSHDDLPGRLGIGFEGLSRYDFQLAIIPLTFLTSAIGAEAFALPTQAGLTFAGVVCLLVLADALFIDPPTGPGTGAS